LHPAIAGQQDGDHLSDILLFRCTAQAAGPGAGEIAHVTARPRAAAESAGSRRSPLSKRAFPALGLARVQLSIAPGNTSSARVAEKARHRNEGPPRSLKVICGKGAGPLRHSRLPDDDR